jgi:hypothetical protein
MMVDVFGGTEDGITNALAVAFFLSLGFAAFGCGGI